MLGPVGKQYPKRATRVTHGASRGASYSKFPGTYRSWLSMRARCLRRNHPQWKDYGGRGISICKEWLCSYEAFLQYMGDRPPGHSIDRERVDGNYEPGNVRWAVAKTQNRNSRQVKSVSVFGETLRFPDMCDKHGLNRDSVRVMARRENVSLEFVMLRLLSKRIQVPT